MKPCKKSLHIRPTNPCKPIFPYIYRHHTFPETQGNNYQNTQKPIPNPDKHTPPNMRLIDVKSIQLLAPWMTADREYAILSQTWGREDVSFREWEIVHPSGAILGQCPHVSNAEHVKNIKKKAGYMKVVEACMQAQRDDIRYLWCGTNCIDKESSAELSEAINSML